MAWGKWSAMSDQRRRKPFSRVSAFLPRSVQDTKRAQFLTSEESNYVVKIITDLWGIDLELEAFTCIVEDLWAAIRDFDGASQADRGRLTAELWSAYQGAGATKH